MQIDLPINPKRYYVFEWNRSHRKVSLVMVVMLVMVMKEDFDRNKVHQKKVSSIHCICINHHLSKLKENPLHWWKPACRRKILQVNCSTDQFGLQARIAVVARTFFGNWEYSMSSEHRSSSWKKRVEIRILKKRNSLEQQWKMFEETPVFDAHWLKLMFSKNHCRRMISDKLSTTKSIDVVSSHNDHDAMVWHSPMTMKRDHYSSIQIPIPIEDKLTTNWSMSLDWYTNSNSTTRIFIHLFEIIFSQLTFMMSNSISRISPS